MIRRGKIARPKWKQVSFRRLDRSKSSFPIPTTIWDLQNLRRKWSSLRRVEKEEIRPSSSFRVCAHHIFRQSQENGVRWSTESSPIANPPSWLLTVPRTNDYRFSSTAFTASTPVARLSPPSFRFRFRFCSTAINPSAPINYLHLDSRIHRLIVE